MSKQSDLVSVSQGSGGDPLYIDTTNDRVGVGTTSPAQKLDVSGSIAVSDTTTPTKRLQLDSGASSHTINSANYGSDMMDLNIQAENLKFNTGLIGVAERMRIDSSGQVLVFDVTRTYGNTSSPLYSAGNSDQTSGAIPLELAVASASGGFRYLAGFSNTSGFIGSISVSGSTTSYNTTSDYRLKENVTPLNDAANRLAQIPVHRFNFISDPDTTVDGFLAHEVQAIVPEAVHGEKDAVNAKGQPEYQGIDQSKLVPLLTAALQEALQKIDALEARVAALEAV